MQYSGVTSQKNIQPSSPSSELSCTYFNASLHRSEQVAGNTHDQQPPVDPSGAIAEVAIEYSRNIAVGIGSVVDVAAQAYLTPALPERDNIIYTALGVPLFKKALMHTIGAVHRMVSGPEGTNYVLGGSSLEDLKRMERHTQVNEMLHLFGAITGAYALSDFAFSGTPIGVTALVIQVINAYCIFLQRYNRQRLLAAIDQKETRTQASTADLLD